MANVQRERELTRWMISSLATRGSLPPPYFGALAVALGELGLGFRVGGANLHSGLKKSPKGHLKPWTQKNTLKPTALQGFFKFRISSAHT